MRVRHAQPQTLSTSLRQEIKHRGDFGAISLNIVAWPDHVETTSELQHRLDEVLLIPGWIFLHPTSRVVIRQKYIMDVHDNARPKLGNYVKQQVCHVAASFELVTRIDKQDVIAVQPVDDRMHRHH